MLYCLIFNGSLCLRHFLFEYIRDPGIQKEAYLHDRAY